MIFNPIIRKEVLSALRTRKAVVMEGLFLLVTAALVWLLWPADGLQDIGGRQARRILSVLAVAEVVMVAMFAPAFTAASLTGERERNTLESLFATAMRPGEIALGKMVGSLGFLVLVVLSGIPALASPLLLGGLKGSEVVAVVAVLLLTAVYLGMIGLLVSSMMHRSYRAIIVTFGVLAVVCFLVAFPAWPVSGDLMMRGGRVSQMVLHTTASLSPLQAMLSLVLPESAYAAGVPNMPPCWQMFFYLSIPAILLTGGVCWARLRRPISPPRPREKLKVVERNHFSGRTILYMYFFDPNKRKKNIGPLQNPVLMKEFRTRPILQARWLMRAISICLITSILLMSLVTLSVMAFVAESMDMIGSIAAAVGAMMVVLIILVGPAMTGGAICSDRETGVWDLLRTTRLSSWTIVSGKFQAAIIPLLLLATAMMPALGVLMVFKLDIWPNVLHISYVVGMTVLFVATVGMFFSSIFSRTSTATAWTYALVLTLGLLTLLVLMGEDLFSQRFIAAVFLLNPVAAVLAAAGSPSMQSYDLMVPHLAIMGSAVVVMFAVTVFRVFQLRRMDSGA